MDILQQERDKYTAIWDVPGYRDHSPGALYADLFEEIVGPPPAAVIDLGCGTGAGGKALVDRGFEVGYVDIVSIPTGPALNAQQPLWEALPAVPVYTQIARISLSKWSAGYCCDVMEHIPPEFVGLVLHRIREATESGFFSIGLTPDQFGKKIGQPLHLTVRPFAWWRDFLKMFGEVVEARDFGHTGVFHVRWT